MIDSILTLITSLLVPFFKMAIPLLAVFFIYATYRLYIDNREIVKETKGNRLKYLVNTISAWSLIGILISLGFALNSYYSRLVEESIYKTGAVANDCRDSVTHTPCDKNRLRTNIISANNKKIDHEESTIRQELQKLKQLNESELVDEAPSIVKDSFMKSMPATIPGLKPKKCSWYQVVCRVIESFKRGANKSYKNKRNTAALELESNTSDFIGKGRKTNEEVFKYANQELTKASLRFKENSKKAINIIFDFFKYSSIFNYIFLSLITLKTILLVLGRVIYCDGKHFIEFSNIDKAPDKDIRTFNGKSSIDLKFNDAKALYVHAKKNPAGCEPRVRFKQVHKLFFGRFPYLLGTKKVDLTSKDSVAELSHVGAKEFVVWKLSEDNVVVFNMKNLIAFSDQIKFKRKLSFKLSTLLFGSVFFPTARGPGYLVFQTNGKASKNDEKNACKAVDVSRHIGWDENSKFLAKVSLTPWDTLVTGFNLEKDKDSPGAVDSDSDTSIKNSIGRFLKYFVIPF